MFQDSTGDENVSKSVLFASQRETQAVQRISVTFVFVVGTSLSRMTLVLCFTFLGHLPGRDFQRVYRDVASQC